MAKNDFKYGGWNYYTSTVARSWLWFHQVTMSIFKIFNVACGSEIMTVNSTSGSTLQCDTWLSDDMPWNSPKVPNVRHIGILNLVSILTISPQSTCHSAPVCEILSKSDHPQQKNDASIDFQDGGFSAILDFRGPIMSSLKSPCTTSYRSSIESIALNCLFLRKSRFSILAF